MSLITKLPQWFETKPLILLKFEDGYEAALSETRHGLGRFTVVKGHSAFSDLKLPSLCLAEMRAGESRKFFVGVVKSKAAVRHFSGQVNLKTSRTRP